MDYHDLQKAKRKFSAFLSSIKANSLVDKNTAMGILLDLAIDLVLHAQKYSALNCSGSSHYMREVIHSLHCFNGCVSMLCRVYHLATLTDSRTHKWHTDTVRILCVITENASIDLLTSVEHSTDDGNMDGCEGQFLLCSDQLLSFLQRQLTADRTQSTAEADSPNSKHDTPLSLSRQLTAPLELFMTHIVAVARICPEGTHKRALNLLSHQLLGLFRQLLLEEQKQPTEISADLLSAQISSVCQQLREKVELSEHVANTALLRQILLTFSSAGCCSDLESLCSLFPASTGGQTPGDILSSHALATDRLFDLCQLALSCSLDTGHVTAVAGHLRILGLLEPLLSQTVLARNSVTEGLSARAWCRDKGQQSHGECDLAGHNTQLIVDLSAIWQHVVELIRRSLDSVAEPGALLHVAECELATLVGEIRPMSHDSPAGDSICWHAIILEAAELTKRVVHFTDSQLTEEDGLSGLLAGLRQASDCLNRAVWRAIRVTSGQGHFSDRSRDRCVRILMVVVTYLKRIRSHLNESNVSSSNQTRITPFAVSTALQHLTILNRTPDAVFKTPKEPSVDIAATECTHSISLDFSKYLNFSASRFTSRPRVKVRLNLSTVPPCEENVSSSTC